jgi:hypothetical protein
MTIALKDESPRKGLERSERVRAENKLTLGGERMTLDIKQLVLDHALIRLEEREAEGIDGPVYLRISKKLLEEESAYPSPLDLDTINRALLAKGYYLYAFKDPDVMDPMPERDRIELYSRNQVEFDIRKRAVKE